jgi:hypothetical protein
LIKHNERDNRVGLRLLPVTFEKFDDRGMMEPDQGVKDRQDLGGTKGPTVSQQKVVDILGSYTGNLPGRVQRVEQFLDIEAFNFPGPPLILDCRAQRVHRAAVAASGIKVYKGYLG